MIFNNSRESLRLLTERMDPKFSDARVEDLSDSEASRGPSVEEQVNSSIPYTPLHARMCSPEVLEPAVDQVLSD